MSTRPTTPARSDPVLQVTHLSGTSEVAELRDAHILEQRARFRIRHARALTGLMDGRDDLRGVHALADLVDDAVRWTA